MNFSIEDVYEEFLLMKKKRFQIASFMQWYSVAPRAVGTRQFNDMGPLLLTWINFNPSMDK